jgi:hypothetical protein
MRQLRCCQVLVTQMLNVEDAVEHMYHVVNGRPSNSAFVIDVAPLDITEVLLSGFDTRDHAHTHTFPHQPKHTLNFVFAEGLMYGR